MEAGGGGKAKSSEVVAADGKKDTTGRLTQEEIEHAMALEREHFRAPGLDLLARLPGGDAVLEPRFRPAVNQASSAIFHIDGLMEAGGGGKAKSSEVVAADGKNETTGRRTRRLTQEEIEHAMALERKHFRPPGLDLFARLPGGDAILESLARAAKYVDELQDDKMKYKEWVLREYADKGYVELTDSEDDGDEGDEEEEEWWASD